MESAVVVFSLEGSWPHNAMNVEKPRVRLVCYGFNLAFTRPVQFLQGEREGCSFTLAWILQ